MALSTVSNVVIEIDSATVCVSCGGSYMVYKRAQNQCAKFSGKISLFNQFHDIAQALNNGEQLPDYALVIEHC